MAKILSKSGIAALQVVKPGHVTQSIDAFTGIDAYDISLSGSFSTTGSLIVKGTSTFTNGPITSSVSVGIGTDVIANGTRAFAHGTGSNATGDFSFAQGRNTIASGFAAHAEGLGSQAEGSYSHAEGRNTIASGSYSNTQGRSTTASGDYSHAEGHGSVAFGNYQLVAGQYNISSSDNAAFMIGNGADTNNRSNILFAGNNKIELNAPVTASSNISSSGIVYMTTASIGGGIFTSASLAATSGGGGSTPTLQQVTDQGSSTTTPITASIISASNTVFGITGSFSHLQGNSPITVGDQITFQQPVTASTISASGNISGVRLLVEDLPIAKSGTDTVSFGTNNIFAANITGSNISASNTVFGITGSFSHLQGNSPITIGDQVTFQQPITSSGEISSSGDISGFDLNLFGGDIDLKNDGSPSTIKLYCESSNAHYTQLQAASHSVYSGNVLTVLPPYDFDFAAPNFQANVTASGAISSSGTVSMATASIGGGIFTSASLAAGGGGSSAETNFTQSLFVTPSGNNGTAIVGDMLKPFQTILAATASANVGDTIIVYPGEYITDAQIAKDNVNYYFYPGAVVSGSTSLVAGTFENLNIRGHGTFKTNYNGAPVGDIIANGYFECDRVEFAGLSSAGYAGSPKFTQNVSADPNGVLQLKGDYKYGLIDGARTGNGFNAAMRFGEGNIIANCNAFVSSSTEMMGIEIATATDTDVIFNGDVYAENGVAVYTNDRAAHVTLTGRFETGNQATYQAIKIVPAYVGRYIINGEIIGSIRIDTGEASDSGVQIDGIQICTSSPDSCAVKIDGGYNTLNHTIRASEIIFDVNGGETHFYGAAYISQASTGKLFDVSTGRFVWNGMNVGTNIRALSNVISGGELIINGPLEHYGSSYPNNTECFDLSGGILEIKNQVRYHQNTTGSGFVDMSGGYLKLNGAELIHNDGTGSYAPCIKLTGGQTGSFFNNSFTNLNVFNDSTLFLNEMAGSGSLFFTDKLR